MDAGIIAMGHAKKNGVKISLDLSSSNIIESKKEYFMALVTDFVDLLFVNEEEAASLTGKRRHDALHAIAEIADIAVVKLGEQGSILKHGKEILTIPAYTVHCIDTTGAGDMYAAGILYGLTHGKSLEKSARIASYAASKVVEQLGARLPTPLKNQSEMRGLLDE